MEQKKAKRTEEETEQRKERRFVIQDRQSFPGGTLWVVIDTQTGKKEQEKVEGIIREKGKKLGKGRGNKT